MLHLLVIIQIRLIFDAPIRSTINAPIMNPRTAEQNPGIQCGLKALLMPPLAFLLMDLHYQPQPHQRNRLFHPQDLHPKIRRNRSTRDLRAHSARPSQISRSVLRLIASIPAGSRTIMFRDLGRARPRLKLT